MEKTKEEILVNNKKEKTKLSFLPFNMFYCIATGFSIFTLLWVFGDLSLKPLLTISLLFYLSDVHRSTTEDYLLYKIKELEKK